MNTVFVGGSRHVSRLPSLVVERLNNITSSGAHVIVGDANGADKAVQKFLIDNAYQEVTVFCSGHICRNNLGDWQTRNIDAPKTAKGFSFYAVKDREMAREADFGLMIWDGKSIGTILNIFRLLQAGKKVVLVDVARKITTTFKTRFDWDNFFPQLSAGFRSDFQRRATPEEWMAAQLTSQESFFESSSPSYRGENAVHDIKVVDKTESESQISKENGVAKERNLPRSEKDRGLIATFRTILSIGLHLVRKLSVLFWKLDDKSR